MSVGGRACSLHDVIPAAAVVLHNVEACFVVAACVSLVVVLLNVLGCRLTY